MLWYFYFYLFRHNTNVHIEYLKYNVLLVRPLWWLSALRIQCKTVIDDY